MDRATQKNSAADERARKQALRDDAIELLPQIREWMKEREASVLDRLISAANAGILTDVQARAGIMALAELRSMVLDLERQANQALEH